MLCLILQIGDTRCALDASQVVEVLPLVQVRPILEASPGLAGLMIYRGEPVPVIDLCQLLSGQPAPARLSTRIVVVKESGASSDSRPAWSPLGLIVERATGIRRGAPNEFVPVSNGAVGPSLFATVATDAHGFIYELEVSEILRRLGEPVPTNRATNSPAWASSPSKTF